MLHPSRAPLCLPGTRPLLTTPTSLQASLHFTPGFVLCEASTEAYSVDLRSSTVGVLCRQSNAQPPDSIKSIINRCTSIIIPSFLGSGARRKALNDCFGVADTPSIPPSCFRCLAVLPGPTMLTCRPPASGLAVARDHDALSKLASTTERLSIPAHDSMDDAMASSSESDLSDVPDHPASSTVPLPTSDHPSPSDDAGGAAEPSASDDDVNMVSEDGDFHADSPPRSVSAPRDSRSASEESCRPSKRKLGIENDEDIMNNPELYGIRRSVRAPRVDRVEFAKLTSEQGRARHTARIVSLTQPTLRCSTLTHA